MAETTASHSDQMAVSTSNLKESDDATDWLHSTNRIESQTSVCVPTTLWPERTIRFIVEYHSGRTVFELKDTQTVGHIKETLEKNLQIPADVQELKGLRRGADNFTKLHDLYLSKEVVLYLLNPANEGGNAANIVSHRKDEYRLRIVFINGANYSIYNITARGNKKIGAIRKDVSFITKIPMERLMWKGLSSTVKDETLLCESGIRFPFAEFEVIEKEIKEKASEPSDATASESSAAGSEIPSDTMGGSAADADIIVDSLEVEYLASPYAQGLMTAEMTTEMEAVQQFSQNFEKIYGLIHPNFLIGSLKDAIKVTLQCKVEDRKLLALYLHHAGSIQVNIFCDQLLCTDSISTLLSTDFVVWAWDLTYPEVKERFIRSASSHFGAIITGEIRAYALDDFPALIIISRPGGTNQVLDIIKGHVNINDLMTRLLHAVEVFKEAVVANKEFHEREKLIKQQDKEYEESLRADREKAKAGMDKQQAQEEERMESLEMENEAHLEPVPDEPPQNAKGTIAHLRFRQPSGQILSRRFWGENTLQDIVSYLAKQGVSKERYKVITAYPPQDVTELDLSQTLQQANLMRNLLIIEERN